jgi:hypothetical protein
MICNRGHLQARRKYGSDNKMWKPLGQNNSMPHRHDDEVRRIFGGGALGQCLIV